MSDVLLIVAPVAGAYPSVNELGRDGRRGGRKTRAFHDLFREVKEAAEAEIARVGWTIAEYPCAVDLVFYHARAPGPDASNLSKCELDALTAACVWADDRLARPVRLETEYDTTCCSHVIIIVRRRFPAYVAGVSAAEVTKRLKPRARAKTAPTAPKTLLDAAPPARKRTDFVEVNGKLVPRADFDRDLRSGKLRIR